MRSIRLIKRVVVELMKQEGDEKEGTNQNGNRGEEEWTIPEEMWMKVNCHGAFSIKEEGNRREEAGIGVVVRDGNGRVVTGVARKMILKSGIEVEAAALRDGVFLAESMGIQKIVLEIDSEIMFKELEKGKGKGNWKIKPYIQNILGKKDCFEGKKFSKIKRSANKTTDWLAKQVKQGMSLTN